MIGTGVVKLAGVRDNACMIEGYSLVLSLQAYTPLHTTMSEVVGSETQDPAPTKSGRQSRFTPQQDLAIVREVAAVRAHLAEFGETKKRFAAAAERLRENVHFRDKTNVGWKTIQDRYKRLQDQYDKNDSDNQRLSGVGGGEMGELADLLMTLMEARDDLEAKKKTAKLAEERKEEVQERMGRLLMVAAQKRKSSKDSETEDSSCRNENGAVIIDGVESEAHIRSTNGSVRKKKKTKMVYGADYSLDAFGEHMEDADLARISLERERLQFEREMAERGREERLEERLERQKEREEERRERREEYIEQQKLELEKFKALIEAFARKK